GPELVQRRAAASAPESAVHGAREERGHLEARDIRGRIVGRRRRAGRDPEVEDLQDERAEGVIGDIGEGTAKTQEVSAGPSKDSRRENQATGEKSPAARPQSHDAFPPRFRSRLQAYQDRGGLVTHAGYG